MSEQPHNDQQPRGRGRPRRVEPPAAAPERIETPEERTRRLANKRVNACLFRLRQIGNLSASVYGLNEEQTDKIINTVQAGVDEMCSRLLHRKNKPENWSL